MGSGRAGEITGSLAPSQALHSTPLGGGAVVVIRVVHTSPNAKTGPDVIKAACGRLLLDAYPHTSRSYQNGSADHALTPSISKSREVNHPLGCHLWVCSHGASLQSGGRGA
jgi:hypothetical protein